MHDSGEAAVRNFATLCEIHTFDPEPRSEIVVELIPGGPFHAWGIAAQSTNNPLDDHKYKTSWRWCVLFYLSSRFYCLDETTAIRTSGRPKSC
jgi:hypothetical protein